MKRHLLLIIVCVCWLSCKKQDDALGTPASPARRAYLMKAIAHVVGNYHLTVNCTAIDSTGIETPDTTYIDSMRVTAFQDTVLIVGGEHLYYSPDFDSDLVAFVYAPPTGIYYDVALIDTGYTYFSFYRFAPLSHGQGMCVWNFF